MDLSKLKHEDDCRYWRDGEFCTCGAVDAVMVEQLTRERDALRAALIDIRLDLQANGRSPVSSYTMAVIDAALAHSEGSH